MRGENGIWKEPDKIFIKLITHSLLDFQTAKLYYFIFCSNYLYVKKVLSQSGRKTASQSRMENLMN